MARVTADSFSGWEKTFAARQIRRKMHSLMCVNSQIERCCMASMKHYYTIKDGPSVWDLIIKSLMGYPQPADMVRRYVRFRLNYLSEDKGRLKTVAPRGLVEAFERVERDSNIGPPEYALNHSSSCFLLVYFPEINRIYPGGIWVYGYYQLIKRKGWFQPIPVSLLDKSGCPVFLKDKSGILMTLMEGNNPPFVQPE